MGVMDQFRDMNQMKQVADNMKKEAQAMRVSGVSKRSCVSLVLDGEKTLRSIEFSDDALRLSKGELAKMCQEAHKVAAKEIDKLMQKQMKQSPFGDLLTRK